MLIFKQTGRSLFILRQAYLTPVQSLCTKVSTTTDVPKQESVKEDISKAMKAYLERAHQHNEFMKQQKYEFQIGKRHLANMMGEDPETFTQEDIDNAIEYLFPSGLYEKKARPMMKPPEEVFPQRKEAEFDESGRPFHFLFYTGRPHFYKLLYDVVEHMDELYKINDQMVKKQNTPDADLELSTNGYEWLKQDALGKKLVEPVSDRDYKLFVEAMDRLLALPYSYKCKEFIDQYRIALLSQKKSDDIPALKYDEQGRAYLTVYECLRKRARGHVTVRTGTGKISINDADIAYFHNIQSREQLLFPLVFTNMQTKVDVEAYVEGGGFSGQAGAIRWGIATALRSFVTPEMVEKMRIAGLLTRDYRTRERKKPGQEGARKKFTWKKR